MAKKPAAQPTTNDPTLAALLAEINGFGAGASSTSPFYNPDPTNVIGSQKFGQTGLTDQFFDPNALFPSDTGAQPGGSGIGQRPLYVQGDEWNELPTNPTDLASLQHGLVQAGYLSEKNVVYGSPDPATASAMAQLLATSNASGVGWKSALSSRLAQAALNPPEAARADPLVISLTNPDDIKAVIQSGANQVFGKFLDPAEVDKFVSSYQSQQAAYQTDVYKAGGYDPTTGRAVGPLDSSGKPVGYATTVTKPATGEGEQRQFFDQMAAAHPTETRTALFMDALSPIIDALHGPQVRIQA